MIGINLVKFSKLSKNSRDKVNKNTSCAGKGYLRGSKKTVPEGIGKGSRAVLAPSGGRRYYSFLHLHQRLAVENLLIILIYAFYHTYLKGRQIESICSDSV